MKRNCSFIACLLVVALVLTLPAAARTSDRIKSQTTLVTDYSDGEPLYSTVESYEYLENGEVKSWNYKDGDYLSNASESSTYDEDGNILETVTYSKGTLTEKKNWTYDEDSRLLSYVDEYYYSDFDKYVVSGEYTYDNEGRTLTENHSSYQVYAGAGNMLSYSSWEYVYDAESYTVMSADSDGYRSVTMYSYDNEILLEENYYEDEFYNRSIYRYDGEGNLVDQYLFYDKVSYDRYSYVYDAEGQVIAGYEFVFDPWTSDHEVFLSSYTVSYDNGIKAVYYDADGNEMESIEQVIDEYDNIKSYKHISNGITFYDLVYDREYDEQGRILKEMVYYFGEADSGNAYEYGADGRSFTKYVEIDGEYRKSYEEIYDAAGNIIEERDYDLWDDDDSDEPYSVNVYVRDAKGNPISIMSYYDGELSSRTLITYTYFPE